MEKCNNLNNPSYKISKQVPQATSRRYTNLTGSTARIKRAPRSRSRSPTRSSSLSLSISSTGSHTSRRSSSSTRSRTLSTRSRTSRPSSSPACSSTLSTRSRTPRRSSSSSRSNASSVRSPSTSRSLTRKNSSARSCSLEESSAPISLTAARYNRSPNISLLPEEEEAELSYDDSKDNNFEKLFKSQIFALNAIVENLNKDIGTHREILKTAKQMNSEVKDLNKNINQLTDSINNELTEDRVHNKKVELLYLKKQILTIQLAACYKAGA